MIIILVIEHIAIAKSFARTFNYTVVPSQEILAQGASNLLGTFVGGYVCTGSFGASAVLSKAGVRTPLAGLFSAVILVLGLHVLTSVFYYIPNAALAGLIVHAVANLPTPPRVLYKYWRLSPPEFIIWAIGVVIAIFVSLEVSIYVTICVSLALVLIRVARGKGLFLGQSRVHHIQPVRHCQGSPQMPSNGTTFRLPDTSPSFSDSSQVLDCPDDAGPRDIYLPLGHDDGSNPAITVFAPHPGVFIYQFPSGLNYMNQGQHMRRLVSHIKKHTRPGAQPISTTKNNKNTSLQWSEVGKQQQQKQQQHQDASLPRLRAVVLDCTAVDTLDITAVQGLVDARDALDRHAGGGGGGGGEDGDGDRWGRVQWHFAGPWNRWARRALAVAGFGIPRLAECYRAGISGGGESVHDHYAYVAAVSAEGSGKESRTEEVEGAREGSRWLPVRGLDRPCFHVDLTDAVDAAVRDARSAEARERVICGEGCAGSIHTEATPSLAEES